jgi:hypothetical protein
MNIYGRHGKYIVNSQGSYEVAWKLKGLSYEKGWLKSVDTLGASPCKWDLSNNTTFLQQISLDSPFNSVLANLNLVR